MRDPTNLWMRAAVFSSLADGAGDLFVALAGDARIRRDPMGQEWLRRLATMIGVKGRAEEVAQVLGFVNQLESEPQQAFALLYALGDGLASHSQLTGPGGPGRAAAALLRRRP